MVPAQSDSPFRPIPDDPDDEWAWRDKNDRLRAYVIHRVENRNWYSPEDDADEIIAVVKGWCDENWND